MGDFTWWNEEQKKFASEIKEFVNELMPKAEEAWWKREVPWDVLGAIAERGYLGVAIPKEYGGMDLGAIGACILAEELSRLPVVGIATVSSWAGGLEQIKQFGTEEQKKKFLPSMARSELHAIAITEPFVGTDAAAIETVARRDGDKYIITGKKRFVTAVGVASRYMLYARTSDEPEDIRRRRHLTGFIVEKGMPGFTVEKVNELIGLDDNLPNGYLNLDEVPVPIGNRIGTEGEGWRTMVAGLNFERLLGASVAIGQLNEVLRYLVPYGQRRIQFGIPTIDMPTNQLKIADMISKIKLARLITYYAAHLLDLGQEAAMECTISKVFATDIAMEVSLEAAQVMGGDGVTKFYPLERILRNSKVGQIYAGTNEAGRLVIYRVGLREMADDLKMPHRIRHEQLGVPISATAKPEKQHQIDEDTLLKVLAEDYRVNPGLYMKREDLKDKFDVADDELDRVMLSLEQKNLAKLFKSNKGIELVKATYEGLRKANPPDHYKWYPTWVRREEMF